jgi:di/tricarboxylate transporter
VENSTISLIIAGVVIVLFVTEWLPPPQRPTDGLQRKTPLWPSASAPITMTLAGGYRFKEYVIVGGLLVVVCTIATICIYPLLFDL